ncbi:MAG: gallidermin family lantibiotic [Bdellovibrionales bacterium]|nr:gallidermin family lantibiotic [Bdellovibrionales bacterium]
MEPTSREWSANTAHSFTPTASWILCSPGCAKLFGRPGCTRH